MGELAGAAGGDLLRSNLEEEQGHTREEEHLLKVVSFLRARRGPTLAAEVPANQSVLSFTFEPCTTKRLHHPCS